VWTDPLILEFLFGGLVALMYQACVKIPGPIRVLMIAGAVLTIFQFHVPELPSQYRWAEQGVPTAIIVAASVLGPQDYLNGMLGTAAKKLGDCSYSIYLLHVLVLAVIVEYGSPVACAAEFIIGTAAVIVLSLASYRYFEKPLTEFLKAPFTGRLSASRARSWGIPPAPHAHRIDR
jgi:exopolysaccharide production protein ExoZ